MKCIYSALLAILVLPTTASAMDIDEHCTVNIMNRTVQVQTDGTWRMNNVPSFMGRVRARATCVDEGITTSGQSEFFSLTTNNLTVVEDIFFDDPSPIPVALDFSNASTLTLNNAATSVSLDVRATYSDGSFSPTLNASNGINFVSSNPNIVRVDENGVLMAVSSGQALITARLEGTVALKQVTAILSGDMDGDGLPDSYELANGLDPNDPIDALEDSDKDGLNALAEFNAGTDIHKSDTDGDGINDSEELIAGIDGFITNPLLADTDGDGFSDGLEVDLETDPSDSNSFDLANALESISITPNTLNLVFNGVDTEVSAPIMVTGHLIDGFDIDITSSSFGTTYSSDDLTIASFGVNDGEIFGGIGGTTTITASNNGYSDSIAVEVERFNPVALSYIDLPSGATNVDVQGDYAYVSSGNSGLVVINVSDRSAPYVVAELVTGGVAEDIKVLGSYAYLADGDKGIQVINVANPELPVLLSTLDTRGYATDLAVDSDHVYVADGSAGIAIINVTDPTSPITVAYVRSISNITGIAIDGNTMAAINSSMLYLVDISMISSPTILSSLPVSTPVDLTMLDDYVHLVAYSNGYSSIDISDAANPIVKDNITLGALNDLALQDGLLLAADVLFVNAVPFFNVSDPANPTYQGSIDFSAMSDYDGLGIAADNQYVYFVSQKGASKRLYLGQYRQVTDAVGVAPEVTIIEPVLSQSLVQGGKVDVMVDAVDDLAVKQVEFSMNGDVLFVDNSAPYSTQLIIPKDASELDLSISAVDWGNNVTVIKNTYSVKPDFDRDGLSDEDEVNLYSTLPRNPDTDGDSLSDGLEVLIGTNPLEEDFNVLVPGLQFYLSAIASNGLKSYEDALTPEFLGFNADNAIIQNLRLLRTWNRMDDLILPGFSINTVFEVHTSSMCWSNDYAYLYLTFYNEVDEYIGEFRFLPLDSTWRGQVQYESKEGETTVITRGYGSYSDRLHGELSFSDSQLRFQHGRGSYGIDNFTLNVDLSEVSYIKASAGVYATYTGGTCGAVSWLRVKTP